MRIIKNGKDEAYFALLRSQTNEDGSVTHVQTSLSVRTGVAPMIEVNGISYGEAVNIDINNLDDLGLGDDIVTYGMDEDGNFFTELENGMDMDFDEAAPEEFLFDMSGGATKSMTSTTINGETQYEGLEEENFWLRRVEKDGETIGYFISGEEDAQYGFYIGTDEIDFANLPEAMRNTLSQPEQPSVPEAGNSPTAPAINEPLQTLDTFQPR